MSKGPVAGRENERRPMWRSGALRENSRVSLSRPVAVDLGVWRGKVNERGNGSEG